MKFNNDFKPIGISSNLESKPKDPNNDSSIALMADDNLNKLFTDMFAEDIKVSLNLRVSDDFQANIFPSDLYKQFLSRPDLACFLNLIIYNAQSSDNVKNILDTTSFFEAQQQNLLLNYLLSSDLFRLVSQYIKNTYNITAGRADKILGFMHQAWFNIRLDRGIPVTGFQHVFKGYASEKKMVGLHSWVNNFLLSDTHNVKFKVVSVKDVGFNIQNELDGGHHTASCFNGTSPMFDLLLYTTALIYCKSVQKSFIPSTAGYRLGCKINNFDVTLTIVEREGMIVTAYPALV